MIGSTRSHGATRLLPLLSISCETTSHILQLKVEYTIFRYIVAFASMKLAAENAVHTQWPHVVLVFLLLELMSQNTTSLLLNVSELKNN